MLHCQLAVGIMMDGSRANRLIEHFEVWRAVHITAAGNQYSLRRTAQSRQRWHQIEGAEHVDPLEFLGTIVSDGRQHRQGTPDHWRNILLRFKLADYGRRKASSLVVSSSRP